MSARAQDGDPAPKTNLELFRILAGEIAGGSFGTAVHADSPAVAMHVLPQESAWLVEDDVAAALRGRGARLFGKDARYAAEFGIVRLHVLYENIRRDGMFGPRIVDREVVVTIRAKIEDTQAGAVLTSGDVSRDRRDTVAVSAIDGLETPTVPATHGVLPSEGFFTSLAEPLIMLGAVAVAVVLLFTVRS